MRPLFFILLLALSACGQKSSPEGRLTLKLEGIQKQLDSIKKQNVIISDSHRQINNKLKGLKEQE